jgi:hypothetical protein
MKKVGILFLFILFYFDIQIKIEIYFKWQKKPISLKYVLL